MVAFWQTLKKDNFYWGYLFFIGLAIGLMSKGPVAAVLIMMPIISWLMISRNWQDDMHRFPLFSGTLLMLALSLPWYLMAEHATPGFLNYYIIGEHWERFTTANWQGNQFGGTKSSFIGAIWVYWLIAAFPMSLILIIALFNFTKWKKPTAFSSMREDGSLYLGLWIITLLLFFSFTNSTTVNYVSTSLPAAALLVANLWKIKSQKNRDDSKQTRKSISSIALASVLFPLFFLAVLLFHWPKVSDRNTEKFLVESYQKYNGSGEARLIYMYDNPPASAEFYSKGKAESGFSDNEVISILKQESSIYVAVYTENIKKVSEDLKQCLQKIDRFGRYILFEGNKQNCNRIALHSAK